VNARRFVVALLLGAPPLGVVVAGCSTNVSLGGLNPAPSPACKGLPCGAACTVDACGGADDGGCPASPIAGQCDMNGVCVTSGGFACVSPPPPSPCAGKTCGEACDPCASGDPTTCSGGTPPGPFGCDENGTCVPGVMGCPGFDPCQGVACGMPCKAPPCFPDADGGGCEMPPPGECDEMGSCVDPMSVSCTPPFNPCEGKVCGQPCMHCPPMDPTCMEPPGPQACDPSGQCLPTPLMCP
jgi:hypothetical protein